MPIERTPESDGARSSGPARVGRRRAYREVTVSALVTGVLIGLVMNAAITYSGLKIGFTIGGSAIAAVLGFAVLRGLLRKGSIVETNIVQTVASAVGNSNAGVIFTLPALLILGIGFDVPLMILGCTAGVILGVAFIIPLRRQMLDLERLKFPGPTAVAAILRSPGAGALKGIVLVIGAIVAAALYLPAALPGLSGLATRGSLEASAVELVPKEKAGFAEVDGYRAARTLQTLPEAEWAALTVGAEPDDSAWFSRYNADAVRRSLLIEGWIEAGSVDEPWLVRARSQRELVERITDAKAYAVEQDVPWVASEDETELPIGDEVGHLLAKIASMEVSGGPVSSLRHVNTWASTPLPGYGWLGIRGVRERDAPLVVLGRDTSIEDADAPASSVWPADLLGPAPERDRALLDSTFDLGALLGIPSSYGLVFALAPFAFAAGFLTGRPGLLVTAGGILAFVIIGPIAQHQGWIPLATADGAVSNAARGLITRPMGIGLLIGGALMGVIASAPAIKAAFAGMGQSGGAGGGERDELSIGVLAAVGSVAFLVLFTAAHFASADAEASGLLAPVPSLLRHLIVAAIGTAWIWFAGIIVAQCAGMTDWSPISGLALMTVLIIMALTNEVVAAVMVGAALCVAISLASDMMGDLRTGSLVGAKPRRQQIVEMATVALGPALAVFVTILLHRAYGLGTTELPAPQGVALADAIRGLQGEGLPYALYGIGIALGGLLGIGAFAGLGVLIGLSMYLPVIFIYTYGLGCVANFVFERIKGREWVSEWCTPFFGGVIIGESLLGLGFAALQTWQSA